MGQSWGAVREVTRVLHGSAVLGLWAAPCPMQRGGDTRTGSPAAWSSPPGLPALWDSARQPSCVGDASGPCWEKGSPVPLPRPALVSQHLLQPSVPSTTPEAREHREPLLTAS